MINEKPPSVLPEGKRIPSGWHFSLYSLLTFEQIKFVGVVTDATCSETFFLENEP